MDRQNPIFAWTAGLVTAVVLASALLPGAAAALSDPRDAGYGEPDYLVGLAYDGELPTLDLPARVDASLCGVDGAPVHTFTLGPDGTAIPDAPVPVGKYCAEGSAAVDTGGTGEPLGLPYIVITIRCEFVWDWPPIVCEVDIDFVY